MELLVHKMHISPYEKGNIFNKDPVRPRRLLLHKNQILRLFGLVKKDGYTLNIQVDEGTYRVSMGGMIMDGKTYYSLAEAKQAIGGGIHDYIQKNPEGFKSAELAQNEILSRINKGEKITVAASSKIRQKWFEEVRRNPYRYIK